MKKNVSAIILAAGSGSRMQCDIPKQFLKLGDKTVLEHTIEVFQKSELVSEIILVVGERDVIECGQMFFSDDRFTKVMQIIAGGKERYNSVQIGLECVDEDTDVVMIHDGARPLVDNSVLERGMESMVDNTATIAVVPVKDTVKILDDNMEVEMTTVRHNTVLVQTPQIFNVELIKEAYSKWEEKGEDTITDDAMLVERYTNTKIATYLGSYKNIKITTPEDMEVAIAYAQLK